MTWATGAELVAAVSNAGGVGSIGPNADQREIVRGVRETAEHLRQVIRRVRNLTDRPFIVNCPIGRGPARAYSDAGVEVMIEERVPAASIVMGSPEIYTGRLKAAGILVLHAVASVKHARKAEDAGVDVVIAESFDGGGHSGFDELPLSVLVPLVRRAVRIPVLAGGGLVDGRGLVAALALGADGVYMGTRFMATRECPVHPAVKQAILDAGDTATVSWGRKVGVVRTLRNRYALRARELEEGGGSLEELQRHMASHPTYGSRNYAGLQAGDLEEGEIDLGAGAGLIQDLPPAGELVGRIVAEAEAEIERLRALVARA
jgi:NAD(P)H-dependent flavin oxidoreductase YrpB (nitropropane dioxygenase family)